MAIRINTLPIQKQVVAAKINEVGEVARNILVDVHPDLPINRFFFINYETFITSKLFHNQRVDEHEGPVHAVYVKAVDGPLQGQFAEPNAGYPWVLFGLVTSKTLF